MTVYLLIDQFQFIINITDKYLREQLQILPLVAKYKIQSS